MNTMTNDAKLTDELERRLIARELSGESGGDTHSPSVIGLQVVVGLLLLAGMFLVGLQP